MLKTVADIRDPDVLKQAAVLLESENRRLLEEIVSLKNQVRALEGQEPSQLLMQVAELEQQLAVRNKMLFGDKSEKRSSAVRSKAARPKRGHGPKEQPELPQLEQTHELEEADRVCTSCGGALEEWAGQSEDSEEVTVVERRFVLLKHRRKKYRCSCGGCVETALGPSRLIPGGRYSNEFAVAVAIAKYADHLPLERQVTMMARQGLVVRSQTLWDQIEALAERLWPAYERLHERLLKEPVLGADETPWKLLGHHGRRTKRWYAWALCGVGAGTTTGVIYRIDESRSADAAANVLKDFSGTLICDGYTAYESLRSRGSPFRIAHCWAHARRKFVECAQQSPEECDVMLDLIAELYALDAELRNRPAEERLSVRQQQAKPILERIHEHALSIRGLPGSPLQKAVGYLGSMWPGLQVFAEDPHVSLDNNAVERAMRAVVVGRKNHYGSKSKRGTEVAALFYSLIETAKLNGLMPDGYLQLALDAALEQQTIPLPHELAAVDA